MLDVSPWYAVLVGAALAPTDAALGSAVMSDRRVPYRVRQTLNVESGLNDGIVTPVVTFALLAIAADAGLVSQEGSLHAGLALLLGAATGLVLGGLGGILLGSAGRRGWSSEEFAGPALLALALLAFLTAMLISANGFVAAFLAGSAFGASLADGERGRFMTSSRPAAVIDDLPAPLRGFGCPCHGRGLELAHPLYAVLSLTVIRMCEWRSRYWARGWTGRRCSSSAGSALAG